MPPREAALLCGLSKLDHRWYDRCLSRGKPHRYRILRQGDGGRELQEDDTAQVEAAIHRTRRERIQRGIRRTIVIGDVEATFGVRGSIVPSHRRIDTAHPRYLASYRAAIS